MRSLFPAASEKSMRQPPPSIATDIFEVGEVVAHLLNGDEVEPAHDLRDEAAVLVAPLLQAEVRDVPGRDEQASLLARRDPSRALVRAKGVDFGLHLIVVARKLGLRKAT